MYVAVNRTLAVIDPLLLQVLGTYTTIEVSGPIRDLLCIDGDLYLYFTGFVERFDRQAMAFAPEIPGTNCTTTLAPSRADPEILYVGDCGTGGVSRVNRVTETYLGMIGIPWSSYSDEYVLAMEVLPDDEKIYFTRYWEGGIYVADPATGEIRKKFQLSQYTGGTGLASRLALTPDSRLLYAAVRFGDPRALLEINTATDEVTSI